MEKLLNVTRALRNIGDFKLSLNQDKIKKLLGASSLNSNNVEHIDDNLEIIVLPKYFDLKNALMFEKDNVSIVFVSNKQDENESIEVIILRSNSYIEDIVNTIDILEVKIDTNLEIVEGLNNFKNSKAKLKLLTNYIAIRRAIKDKLITENFSNSSINKLIGSAKEKDKTFSRKLPKILGNEYAEIPKIIADYIIELVKSESYGETYKYISNIKDINTINERKVLSMLKQEENVLDEINPKSIAEESNLKLRQAINSEAIKLIKNNINYFEESTLREYLRNVERLSSSDIKYIESVGCLDVSDFKALEFNNAKKLSKFETFENFSQVEILYSALKKKGLHKDLDRMLLLRIDYLEYSVELFAEIIDGVLCLEYLIKTSKKFVKMHDLVLNIDDLVDIWIHIKSNEYGLLEKLQEDMFNTLRDVELGKIVLN